jgi:hypothetical protein
LATYPSPLARAEQWRELPRQSIPRALTKSLSRQIAS